MGSPGVGPKEFGRREDFVEARPLGVGPKEFGRPESSVSTLGVRKKLDG